MSAGVSRRSTVLARRRIRRPAGAQPELCGPVASDPVISLLAATQLLARCAGRHTPPDERKGQREDA
jgi:hypothetical protein